MGHQSAGVSCLSAEPHENNISNHLLHYLGCIEICKRDGFLSRIERESTLTQCEETNQTVKNPKASWKANIEAEKQRIVRLRYALLSDDDDKKLVDEVDDSRVQWKRSREYRENINRVKDWRSACDKENTVFEQEPVHGPSEPYTVEADISVPVIQFNNGRAFEDKDPRLEGKFPNQKTTIDKLFEPNPKESLLYNDPKSDRSYIKYIHIPSNNMQWAEEAIAQYYGESRPDFTATQKRPQRPQTSAQMILQDRYWRGRLHGDASLPPHAKYMSHTCQTVSSSANKTAKKSSQGLENIVLFMPYLHWETSRRQEQFAKEIDKIVIRTASDLAEKEDKAKRKRQKDREQLHPVDTTKQIQHPRVPIPNRQLEDLSDAASQATGNVPHDFESNNALGRYLLAAARLYEAMTTYRDRRLLRKYLPEDSSVHPRRTLDQAYYWPLKSTKKRDRDQVVYRATTATRNAFHRYDEEKNKWPEHEELRNDDCGTCKANIRKVSRVVMVDQLWMWILDSKTLITCFPKRYGANKQDYSGVHKSIRTSLENLGSDQIRTVFELALIVLDQCTTTFFDRTKTLDKRPQVLDEFSKAIGKVMHKQSVAFDRLWRWTDKARKIFRSQGYVNTRGLHIPLLDINPEGKLDREIGDIIEELDIMIRILNTHQVIIKRFVEQAEQILDSDGSFRREFDRNPPRSVNQSDSDETSQPDGQPAHGNPDDTNQSDGRSVKLKQSISASTEMGGRREDYRLFRLRATECQDRVGRHVNDLEALRKNAKKTADDVMHLLTMKQQQASVVQAWQAVRQSDETIKQGRSIMVFTLATIVFLPLSFLTSVFGMNNNEFGDNNWNLKDQLLYIFLISAGVVFISLLFAFSSRIRATIWSLNSRALTNFLTGTGLYGYIAQLKSIEKIADETYAETERKKMDLKRRIFEEKSQKAREEKAEEKKRAFRDKLMELREEKREEERESQTENIPEGSTWDYLCSIFDEIHGVKGSWNPSDLLRNPVLAMSKLWERLGLARRLSSRPKRRGDNPGQGYSNGNIPV